MEFANHLLRGIFGLAVLILIAWLCSANRKKVNWRLVGVALGLQILFALIVLKTTPGRVVFETIGRGFKNLLDFTFEGSQFIFGALGIAASESGSFGFIFAFQVLPTIIFFGALMGVLYHMGLIQPLVKGLGWLMSKTLGISGAEALSAAGNVFLGQTEAPLAVKPYISKMTHSELMTLMAGGMATIAGGVLASYILFLGGGAEAEQIKFATHLLSASIMSAPAAILMAKILMPETGEPETMGTLNLAQGERSVNVIEAASNGAIDGLKLAVNVGAMLLAFIALIALANGLLGWLAEPTIGSFTLYNINDNVAALSNNKFDSLSLEAIFGFVFAPLSWAMGVESNDILLFGSLLGEKIAVNEFVAYASLNEAKELMSERSVIIGTYALCGFANFSSIAIQIGGVGALAPDRTKDLAQLGIRALIGGALASWMTATVAGILI